jgi:hypothetical protein
MWKTDFKSSYMQCAHQLTQTWRQHIYWAWIDETGRAHEGFLRDKFLEWGQRAAGALYHRGVTTLHVKWLNYSLEKHWAPFITCPKTKAWRVARQRQGFEGINILPAWIGAFLDDIFYFACGNDADIKLAHKVMMTALAYLGFELSMKKFEEEGTPASTGEVLGHGCDLLRGRRFVTAYKKARVRELLQPMLAQQTWCRATLEKVVGLLQSIREDVWATWRLHALYNCLYAKGIQQDGYPGGTTKALYSAFVVP